MLWQKKKSVFQFNFVKIPSSSFFPLQQTIDGEFITKRILGDGNKFPSLFLALSSNVADLLPEAKKEFKQIPYYLFCPSVQSCLVSRICKICGLYFASQKMMKAHSSHHRKSSDVSLSLSSEPSKIRPVRIAARRQRELMAVISLGNKLKRMWKGLKKKNWICQISHFLQWPKKTPDCCQCSILKNV